MAKQEPGKHRDDRTHQSGDSRKPVEKPKLTGKYESKHKGGK